MTRSGEVALVYFTTLCATWLVVGLAFLLSGWNLSFAAMNASGVLVWSFLNLFFVLLPAMLLGLRVTLRSSRYEVTALLLAQPLVFASYMFSPNAPGLGGGCHDACTTWKGRHRSIRIAPPTCLWARSRQGRRAFSDRSDRSCLPPALD